MAKKIIFNEIDLAKEILDDGFTKYINSYELSLLAKYLKLNGYDYESIERKLILLCEEHDPYFNKIIKRNMIKQAVDSCKKFKLKENLSVFITEDELNILKEESYKISKILFVMLVVSKYEKFNSQYIRKVYKPQQIGYFANYKFETILKLAKVRMSKSEIRETKYYLDSIKNYISATLKSDESWRVIFVSDKSNVVITINDFSNILKHLPFFCEDCHEEMKRKSNRQIRCKNCQIKIKKSKTKEYVKRHRNEKNNVSI